MLSTPFLKNYISAAYANIYSDQAKYLPVTIDDLLDEDAVLYTATKILKGDDALTKPQREVPEDGTVTITATSTMLVELQQQEQAAFREILPTFIVEQRRRRL